MHPVMPWFFPLAALSAWLGTRTARDLKAEGGPGRRNALWMITLMLLPLLIWLLAQFMTEPWS